MVLQAIERALKYYRFTREIQVFFIIFTPLFNQG